MAKGLEQFYGSNFAYKLDQYKTDLDDGVARYGVHFSDHRKWGVVPERRYFPTGVYFYLLDKNCDYLSGSGFAQDRKYANVARLNLDRLVILKDGDRRNFGPAEAERCFADLGEVDMEAVRSEVAKARPRYEPTHPFFVVTTAIIVKFGLKGFNRVLHDLGYDGIVDYDGVYLPVESCQGVTTWPSGATLVESLKVPRGRDGTWSPWERSKVMVDILRRQEPGSLRLSYNQIQRLRSWVVRDRDVRLDYLSALVRALDFREPDAAFWLQMHSDYLHFASVRMALDHNLTLPERYEREVDALDRMYGNPREVRAIKRRVLR